MIYVCLKPSTYSLNEARLINSVCFQPTDAASNARKQKNSWSLLKLVNLDLTFDLVYYKTLAAIQKKIKGKYSLKN